MPSRPAARCRRSESGGHQPCVAGYTSISAGSSALAKVSFITVFSVGACISSFSAIATRNCALVFAACRCGLFGISVTSPAAMEGGDGSDAVRHRSSGAKRHRPSHAITLRPHLAILGNRGLLVQPSDECLRIRHVRGLVQRLRERHQLLDRSRRALVRGRSFLDR